MTAIYVLAKRLTMYIASQGQTTQQAANSRDVSGNHPQLMVPFRQLPPRQFTLGKFPPRQLPTEQFQPGQL